MSEAKLKFDYKLKKLQEDSIGAQHHRKLELEHQNERLLLDQKREERKGKQQQDKELRKAQKAWLEDVKELKAQMREFMEDPPGGGPTIWSLMSDAEKAEFRVPPRPKK